MTNAERQARFRRRRQAELKRLKEQKARDSGGDWREGKTPEEIAELDDLARQYREADERCTSAIDMQLQELREFAKAADELIELLRNENAALKAERETDLQSVSVRGADRSHETLGEKFRRVEDCQFAYGEALWDYSKALIGHRKRFATDQEFRAWLAENKWEFLEHENDATLLIKREFDLDDWDEAVSVWKIVADLIEFEPMPDDEQA